MARTRLLLLRHAGLGDLDVVESDVQAAECRPLDVEELMAARGVDVSYETIRCWTIKFGPQIARQLRPTMAVARLRVSNGAVSPTATCLD